MGLEHNIRFCIADLGAKLCAASWKLWSPPNKNDIYLAGRELKGAVKISLHESGTWHLAYDDTFYGKNIPDDAATDKGRFIHTWSQPVNMGTGTLLALRIITPWTAVGSKLTTNSKLQYIDPPYQDEAVEIGIFITTKTVGESAWPGKVSLNGKLIGSYVLPNGSTVFAAHWLIKCPDFSNMPTKFRPFKGVDRTKLPETIRAMMFSDHKDGSKIIYDLLGKVSKVDV